MKRVTFVVSVVFGTWMIAGAAVAQNETNPPTAPAVPETAVSAPVAKQPEMSAPATAEKTTSAAPVAPEAAAVPAVESKPAAVESKPADAAAALMETAKPAAAPVAPEAAAVPAVESKPAAVESKPADAAAALMETAKPAAAPEAAAVPAAESKPSAVESKPADAAAALMEAAKPAAVPEAAAVPAVESKPAAVESKPADAAAALMEAAKPAAAPAVPEAAAVVTKPVEPAATVLAVPPSAPAVSKAQSLEELKAAEEALGNPVQIKAGEAIAQQEKVRRAADTIEGRKLLSDADKAFQAENYARAGQLYREVLGKLPVGKENRGLRTHASERATEAVYEQARMLYKQGKLAESMELVQQELAATPDSKPLRRLMTRIQEDQARSAVTGGQKAPPPSELPQGRVNELMQSAANSLAVRDYKNARTALESVLALEPGNREAIRILKEVNDRRYVKNSVERDATVAGMSADVRAKWNPPAYKIVEPPKKEERARVLNSQPIVEKMRKIIIPEIEFRQANVHDVVDFLNKASREGDKETTDPTQKGVNIILNLNPGQAGGASAAPAAAAAADPFGAAATGAAAGAGGRSSYEITFQARYINLESALKIITSVSGLKYLVDGSVVMIVPADYDPAEIVTRMYPVEPDFVGRVKDTAAAMAPAARTGAGGREIEVMGNVDTKSAMPDLKDYFEKMGVVFPKTASITYNAAIGKLIVANTTQNLIKFEQILDDLNKALKKIQQVEIEARFVEVNETDLMELGLEWLLNSSWQILQNKNGGTLLGGRQRIQINGNSAAGGFTRGLNFWGTDAQTGNTAPRVGGAGQLGGLLSVSSILTNPELGVVVHALEQNGNADLLSAPKVTTRVGTEANIKVITEYIYPTEFEMSTPPTSGNGGTGTTIVNQRMVAIPQNFATREVGVILQVMPELSADGNVINLTMTPQVVREPTWYQYGVELPDDNGGTYPVNMPQPFFHTRSITTQISIYDGATVVMGGLIVETVEKFNDKVPILGDIPLLGALFRSKGERSEKKNLLIFVTANVVDPAGRVTRDQVVQGEEAATVPSAPATPATP